MSAVFLPVCCLSVLWATLFRGDGPCLGAFDKILKDGFEAPLDSVFPCFVGDKRREHFAERQAEFVVNTRFPVGDRFHTYDKISPLQNGAGIGSSHVRRKRVLRAGRTLDDVFGAQMLVFPPSCAEHVDIYSHIADLQFGVVRTLLVAHLDHITTLLVVRFLDFPLFHTKICPLKERIRTGLELTAEAVGHMQHVVQRRMTDRIYHDSAFLRTRKSDAGDGC